MKRVFMLSIAVAGLLVWTEPVPAASTPPGPYNWTGFYLGGHIGGAWLHTDWTFIAPGTHTDHNNDGFLGGGQGGFDYQYGPLVLGIAAQGSRGSLDAQSRCPNPSARCRTEPGWLVMLGPRAGFALNRALLYVKGGAAWADEKYFVRFPGTPIFDERGEGGRTGWHAGGGVEYAIWQYVSAKLEYNYLDLGTDRVTFNRIASGAFVERADIKQRGHMATFGINIRFNLTP